MVMNDFLHEDFLLTTESSRRLFHDVAASLPIIDYHSHLSAEYISEDHRFSNLTQAWLQGDHYKWRAMRAHGVDEHFITGGASDFEKFQKWAETVPFTLRNPLFHWTHLELRRYFDIQDLLVPEKAQVIYEATREQLESAEFSFRGLLARMNVELVCTTDDPADDLRHHKKIQETAEAIQVLPTFRPDKLLKIQQARDFRKYVTALGHIAGLEINNYDQLLQALRRRADYFSGLGCLLSDHGLDRFDFLQPDQQKASSVFEKVMEGTEPEYAEAEIFHSTLLTDLCKMYYGQEWAQQFHVGALRNVNSRLFRHLGADIGCDTIGDHPVGESLAGFFSHLDAHDQLTRTILYNLNPKDNALFATMVANFNDGIVPGKMQYGAAWWFLDQKNGIERQLEDVSNYGLLPQFIGMLTDSRSVLSFPRHEYFRRILCDMIGRDIEQGLLPNDMTWMSQLVENVCYRNVKRYLKLGDN